MWYRLFSLDKQFSAKPARFFRLWQITESMPSAVRPPKGQGAPNLISTGTYAESFLGPFSHPFRISAKGGRAYSESAIPNRSEGVLG